MRTLWIIALAGALVISGHAQDAESTNWKGGIDVTWGGTKGTAYQEEYWYHDKLINDTKTVYIRSDTQIAMAHNDRNMASLNNNRPKSLIGASGGGIIRFKLNGLWQELRWAPNKDGGGTLYPAYTGPFTLASTGQVGVTGWNGSYWRAMLETVGADTEEWHVLMVADDDSNFSGFEQPDGQDDSWASDGKYVLLVVNPKTPALTVRATGNGQFYTTPAWTYWVPKIHAQTTYIAAGTGTVTLELRNIYGGNISYRINSGIAVPVGAATVTLDQNAFNVGENTLEYWYDSTPAVIRTRRVVKDPLHPSLGETHGDILIGGPQYWSALQSRITRAPYLSVWQNYLTDSGAGHTAWEGNRRLGRRFGDSNWPYKNSHAAINAAVAKQLGWAATRSGAARSYAAYAKEMLLETPLNQHPVGMETNFWASDSIPAADLYYRGYWDVRFAQVAASAYDVLISGYRSDQVSGGITPIEDLFIRDRMADYVHQQVLQIGNFAEQYTGMWQTARHVGALAIALVMPTYSTPYFGTSGMDGNTTVHQWAPFQASNYTWRSYFLTHNYTATTFGAGPVRPFGLEGSGGLISLPGTLITQPTGAYAGQHRAIWVDRKSYLSFNQMGALMAFYANWQVMYNPGSSHEPLWEYLNQVTGSPGVWGAKDDDTTAAGVNYGPYRNHMITVLNERFPTPAANALPWIRALPTNDPNSETEALKAAGITGIAWYDDQYLGGIVADTTPPTVSSAAVSASGLLLTITLSEQVAPGAGGTAGVAPTASGGALSASYSAGATTSTLTYSLSRPVEQGETVTLSYSQPGNGWEDAAGNDLATFSNRAVTNNSTYSDDPDPDPDPEPAPAIYMPRQVGRRVTVEP